MTHNQNIVYEDDDEDEDDTLTDNHNEFSGIEMSQDCIAWDESNNRDLRASFSNKTTTAGPTGVMDHLKTGSGAVTGNHKNHTANDQEIAGIFSVLGPGKEATTRILPTTNKSFHASTTSSCASEFAAPLRRRNLNQSVRHSFPPNANNDRKRPDFGRSNHARKKLPKRSISGSVPSSRRDNLSPAPLHSSNSSHRVSNSTTTPQHIPGFAALDSSGFDDLLEQMKTPSPAHFAATAETSTAAPQTSTKKNEHSSWTTNNHSNEGQQEASTSTTRTRHHARNNNNANSYQHSTTTMKPKALDVEAFQKSKPVQDKENANASQFISKKTTNNGQRHLKQPLGQNIHKSNSTMNKQTPTSSTTTATTTNTMPPPAAVPSMKQKAAAPSNPLQPAKHQTQSTVDFSANLEEEDEFGDFDFSQVDFDQVDSLVAATQQEQKPVARTTNNTIAAQKNMSADREPLPTPSTVTPPQREEPRPPIVLSHDPAPAATSTSNSGGKNSSPDFLKEQNTIDPLNDDSFGDFPDDIDFDALDAAIATQMPYADHTHQSGPSTCISNGPESNTTAMGQHPMQTTATTTMYQIPPVNAPFRNPRMDVPSNGLTFTRYKVRMVESDAYSFTKTLFVEEWNTSMLQEERLNSIHRISDSSKGQQCDHGAKENSKPLLLRGSMYYIQVEEGDVLHLCSLTGRFKTDPSALPVILNTTPPTGSDEDDLVMILHPDMLSTPTGVTKMLACGRRAVVTSRLGSNGMSSKKMLFGTMRHSLFEVTLRERNFSSDFVRHHIKVIVRKNAEAMISCNMSSSEAEGELFKIFPQLQAFEREYFNPQRPAFLQGNCGQQGINIKFAAKSVAGVEEPVIAPELGLKGNLDVIVDADIGRTGPGATGNTENALMGIELKTNHNTNSQVEHMAQLGLYTMMLLSRFGKTNSAIFKEDPKSHEAITGGMLLYLNGETLRAEHISPNIPDIKNLIEHRNIHSSDYTRTLKPRGVKLIYESEGTDPRVEVKRAPPVDLPEMQQSTHMCNKCFAARECIMYATAEASSPTDMRPYDVRKTHSELVQRFTAQLNEKDFEYFLEWDRLIDMEADATRHSVAEAWLQKSYDRERASGKSISSLVYDSDSASVGSNPDDDSVAFIYLKRSNDSVLRTPLSDLHLPKGTYVTCSTDTTSLEARSYRMARVTRPNSGTKRQFRHQMHIFRGTVEDIKGDDKIVIRASQDDARRVRLLVKLFDQSDYVDEKQWSELHFRLDNDELSSQMGFLRQNLINIFTRDREEVDEKNRDQRIRHEWMKRRLPWLRELIVHLREPVFDEKLRSCMFNVPASIKSYPGCDPFDLMVEFGDLNNDQRAAAEKVATMKDYSLIQGLPGTGKTSTIVFLTRLLAAQGKRVLLTSYTHSAVDNIMLKLMDRQLAALYDGRRTPALVRVGKETSCHPGVRSLLVPKLAAGLEGLDAESGLCSPSAENLRSVMSEARIVGATALTVPRSPLLLPERFDVVIVDEAGQISQPALLGALASADSFILVGDHMQLPPLVQSELAEKSGYGVSMLKRLAEAHPSAVQQLTLQYRMHPEICKLASDAIYDGKLVPAVQVPRLQLPNFPKALDAKSFERTCPWLKRVLNPFRPVVFANTDAIVKDPSNERVDVPNGPPANDKMIVPLERTVSREAGGSMVNDAEATLVSLFVHGLVAAGLSPSSIGVICPFRAQIRLLEGCPQISKWKKEGLEISTIDRYQGRDKEAIVLSFVRSNNKGKVGRLLEDMRRINVAITRAKHKMIMVGSLSTLCKGSTVLKHVLGRVEELQRVETLPSTCIEDCPRPVLSQMTQL